MSAGHERTLPSPDGGARLRLRGWHPAGPPRGVAVISHGLGEHGGRYGGLVQALLARGMAAHAADHRGHGASSGPRGHCTRFAELVADFDHVVREVRAGAPGLPLFVVGHSLGGLVVLRWLQRRGAAPVRGAVLSAPLLRLAFAPPRWKTVLSGVLSRVAPALAFRNELRPHQLSADEAYVRGYRDDPLLHDRITPRLYTEMLAAAGAVPAGAAALGGVPLLFLLPGADPVVDSRAAAELAAGLPGDVTVIEYPGARHEALNDVGRERVVADVLAWMDARA